MAVFSLVRSVKSWQVDFYIGKRKTLDLINQEKKHSTIMGDTYDVQFEGGGSW